MKRKAAALALTVAMTMAVSGSVYAEPKSTEVEPGITGGVRSEIFCGGWL